MDNSNKIEAVEVVYDALKNKTYEFLGNAVINANIGGKKLGLSDEIMQILPARYYDGKEPDNNTEIGFCISEIALSPSEPTEKIVILIDGERLEIEPSGDSIQDKQTRDFSAEEIIGLDPVARITTEARLIDFSLQPNDIKRIAEAKDVGLYIDANDLYDVNGGDINFRRGNGSFQIEGIQGVMKRAYHYFVNETYYVDYCASYLEKKQELIDKEIKWMKEETEKIEQEEKEEEERWYRARRKYLIILLVSVVLFVLGCIIEISFDVDLPWWFALVVVGGFFYSTFELYSIGAWGGGGDGNEE